MKIYLSQSNNCYYNLSLEELLLKDESIKEDILLLYINDNTIVFGRNQNVYEEINRSYIEEHKINLIRRVSGGGAVYHDKGNINFSFITSKEKRSYTKFLTPIIKFLQTLGLNAQFKGKNDLKVDDNKISGNAQYIYKDRMFHHGTLLFDTDLSILGDALKPNKLKMESKGIKSARQSVANINSLLETKMTPEQFTDALINHFVVQGHEVVDYSSYKNDEVKALMNVRKSNEWIFGKNPEFNMSNEKRFMGGTIKVTAHIETNIIKEINFTGDFLSTNNSEHIATYFIGKKFHAITSIINDMKDFDEYFGKITKEEIIGLLVGTNE